jgi:hypothetical protein
MEIVPRYECMTALVLSYNVCRRISCSYIVFYLLQMMEIELRKLADTIKSIHEEMYYLRERYNIAYYFWQW